MEDESIYAACDRAGLKVVGPVIEGVGMDGGVVVAVPYTSPRLDGLDEARWRTCPTGGKHTIVVPR